jgi:large subunit ribosomal protein L21
MFAVIQNWWKQYKVVKWDILQLEKIDKPEWEIFEIKKVLLTFDDKKTTIWTPFSWNIVKVKILNHWRSDKVWVFKKKSKKRYVVNRSHRQHFTEVKIMEIK